MKSIHFEVICKGKPCLSNRESRPLIISSVLPTRSRHANCWYPFRLLKLYYRTPSCHPLPPPPIPNLPAAPLHTHSLKLEPHAIDISQKENAFCAQNVSKPPRCHSVLGYRLISGGGDTGGERTTDPCAIKG